MVIRFLLDFLQKSIWLLKLPFLAPLSSNFSTKATFTKSLFLLLLPFWLSAAEFTSSVDRAQVAPGESITLYLTLKGASTKTSPSLDAFKNVFSVHSQQQQLSTTIMNGRITSSVTWKYTLFALKDGSLTIPSIRLETSEGALASAPITIEIQSENSNGTQSQTKEIMIRGEANNNEPYKNEPFFYTVRIFSQAHLSDLHVENFTIPNAIIEPQGDARTYQRILDGVHMGVVEFDYLITPLKAGLLSLPKIVVQGGIIVPRRATNDMSLFAMLHGLNELKPFSIATEETTIEIQAPIADVSPWLPARSLEIEEVWNPSQSLEVGEPFTREFKIRAEGVKAHQLPDLNNQQGSDLNQNIKIYQDKPELIDERQGDRILSQRIERFTIVPQEAGSVTLPEVKVVWWDTIKKERKETTIPARALLIQASAEMERTGELMKKDGSGSVDAVDSSIESDKKEKERDWLLYGVITGLTIFLLIAISTIIFLQRKLANSQEIKKVNANESKKVANKEIKDKEIDKETKKKGSLPDLNPT